MLHVAQTSSTMCDVIQARHVRSISVVLFVVETLRLAGHSDTNQLLYEDVQLNRGLTLLEETGVVYVLNNGLHAGKHFAMVLGHVNVEGNKNDPQGNQHVR